MPQVTARHNITSGQKGKNSRQTIKAGQQFNTDDFPDISNSEWEGMARDGLISPANDLTYQSPTSPVVVQQGSAAPSAVEGRSPRTDQGAARTIGGITTPVRDEDEDEDETPPARQGRRGRQAKPEAEAKSEEDEDDI